MATVVTLLSRQRPFLRRERERRRERGEREKGSLQIHGHEENIGWGKMDCDYLPFLLGKALTDSST